MPQVLVRDLSSSALSTLKTQAKRNHRSLQGEVKAILEDSAARARAMERFRRDTAKLRGSFGNRKFSNSVDIIRKMRDT
jgi:plasmid stability protein